MEISKTEYKRCDLVKVTGRVDSSTAPELEKAFTAVIEGGKSGIVLDMEDVEFLSSRGIWVLLEAQKACRRDHGKLVLVNVNDNMHQTLDLALDGFHFLTQEFAHLCIARTYLLAASDVRDRIQPHLPFGAIFGCCSKGEYFLYRLIYLDRCFNCYHGSPPKL